MSNILNKEYFEKKYRDVYLKMQSGLIYPASTSLFITIKFSDRNYEKSLEFLKKRRTLKERLLSSYHSISTTYNFKMTIVKPSLTLGIGMEHWHNYVIKNNKVLPIDFDFKYPSKENRFHTEVLEDTVNYIDSKADIWMHIKFNGNGEDEPAEKILLEVLKPLKLDKNVEVIHQIAHSKANKLDGYQGMVLGCRFLENVNNPTDPISIAKNTLIGIEGGDSFGGSYVLAQRFNINWNKLNNLSEEEIHYVIGRNNESVILPDADTSAHIKSSRVQGEDGLTTQCYRLGLPFGRANDSIQLETVRGINSIPLTNSDERGLYFAGYARSAAILESIVANQRGTEIGFTQDKLLSLMKADVGGIYYVPSQLELRILANEKIKTESSKSYTFFATIDGTFNDQTEDEAYLKDQILEAEETLDKEMIKSINTENRKTAIIDIDWTRIDRHFTDKSKSPYLFYNTKDYLFRHATESVSNDLRPVSYRILALLNNSFSSWQDNWYYDRKQEEMYSIKDYLFPAKEDDQTLKAAYHKNIELNPVFTSIASELGLTESNVYEKSVMFRKGLAIRLQLNLLASDLYGFKGRRIYKDLINNEWIPYNRRNSNEGTLITGADTFRIYPEEIIVGCMPNLSLGEGNYLISYLTEKERQDANVLGLSEASGVGHVIPDFELILDKGLQEVIRDLVFRILNLVNISCDCNQSESYNLFLKEPQSWYMKMATSIEKSLQDQFDLIFASIQALKGIQDYITSYEKLARKMAGDSKIPMEERNNLTEIANRLKHLTTEKATNFVEAVQMIYFLHLSLHQTGEPTALGRFDQILSKYAGTITEQEALEIIDAFFIKLDEKVQQNRVMMEDHQYYGNLAMGGSSGPYPQGASLGQWIQQLTIGGCAKNDNGKSDEYSYAGNEITKMVLQSISRLPLNAPCVSLRMTKDTPKEVIDLAAKAILSGGAHPILLNDEKIIKGLITSGDGIGGEKLASRQIKGWNSKVEITSARDYACDGCYEPQFPAENWFSLGGFSALQPLECALNEGKIYGASGESYLGGKRISLRTENVKEIKSYDQLEELYFKHFDYLNRNNLLNQLRSYGANSLYCPSPFLNVLMKECLDKGLDFYSGGTKYNIYAPCYVGITSMVNSLFAIKQLVFDPKNAITTLEELLICLSCNWGNDLKEPFISQLGGIGRKAAIQNRFNRLRSAALNIPKFGRVDKQKSPVLFEEISEFGNRIIAKLGEVATEAFTKPWPQMEQVILEKVTKYGKENAEFGIQFQPGAGTFENYFEMGSWNGASADGRLSGTAFESDLSPTPWPSDLPTNYQTNSILSTMESYAGSLGTVFSDGAPTDLRILEDFNLEALSLAIYKFGQGLGSNVLTITTADVEVMKKAMVQPEHFDLLRARTGGWTNFFVSMFPSSQKQQINRPIEGEMDMGDISKCPFHQGKM